MKNHNIRSTPEELGIDLDNAKMPLGYSLKGNKAPPFQYFKKEDTMAYGEYKNRCIGRLMHFLYAVDMKSDHATFRGPGRNPMIILDGKPYANYSWDDNEFNIPQFEFLGDFAHLNQRWAYEKRHWLAYHGFVVRTYLAQYDPNLPPFIVYRSVGWTPEQASKFDFVLQD